MTRTRTLVLLDSIAHIVARCAGQVVVSGSHGGASAAGFVLDAPSPVREALERLGTRTGAAAAVAAQRP